LHLTAIHSAGCGTEHGLCYKWGEFL